MVAALSFDIAILIIYFQIISFLVRWSIDNNCIVNCDNF